MSDVLRVGMVAGEASGDQLGAHLMAALKARRELASQAVACPPVRELLDVLSKSRRGLIRE